tara:strand:+ start:932 stop:1513 length:582 start_codon:yes stop_codon:yes gene_type:complete
MVKNTKGGNKAKKMSRKQKAPVFQDKIRYATNKDEMYASVTKYYGNGRLLITCNDGVERQCVIRKKFRGRNKRGNEVSLGSYILVGRREWESSSKIEVTDLLYVYSGNQIDILKKTPEVNMSILSTNERNDYNQEDNSYMDFMDEIVDKEETNINFSDEHTSEEEEEEEKEEQEQENIKNHFIYEEKIDINEI